MNQAGRYSVEEAKSIQDSSQGNTLAIEELVALSLPFSRRIDISVMRERKLSPTSQLTK